MRSSIITTRGSRVANLLDQGIDFLSALKSVLDREVSEGLISIEDRNTLLIKAESIEREETCN